MIVLSHSGHIAISNMALVSDVKITHMYIDANPHLSRVCCM